MTKVAIVVQRCHKTIVGGSEALAWQYADILRSAYDVDILTTTALDHMTWANALPAGIERDAGIRLHRFPVTIGRSQYWHRLADRMLPDYQPPAASAQSWGLAAEEELLRHQGPYSEPQLDFLQSNGPDYRAIIFVTYLYPTTYFGMARVPAAKALLVPTLHDEPMAYLRAIKNMARRARSVLWLTEAEQRLGKRLWGDLPGAVTAMAVHTEPAAPARPGYSYVLYSGRIESGKGCHHLVEFFKRYKKANPSELRLVLTGEDNLGLSRDTDIDYRGYVAAEEKFELMAGAIAFAMPSTMESFSIATLEAMAQQTPVLATSQGEVVADHVRKSGGGLCFCDYPEFEKALNDLLADPEDRKAMGERARAYVLAHFQRERVRERLIGEVERVARTCRTPAEPVDPETTMVTAQVKPRLAVFASLPPNRTDIAEFSARLLDVLKLHYAIDVYHDSSYVPHLCFAALDLGCFDYRTFERRAGILDYRGILYQLAPTPYHCYALDTLLRHPGAVAFHRFAPVQFPGWFALAEPPGHSRRALRHCCRAQAATLMAGFERKEPGGSAIDFAHPILRNARRVIVHEPDQTPDWSRIAKQYVEAIES
jgi:glycosyltransferase involved in cell wall biosynthesis